MSRTGLYWTDDRDRLNCAHGVILHGTNCINCERGDIPDTLTPHERAAGPGPRNFVADAVRAAMAGKFHDGGFIPKSMRATGFDTASGPDRTATGTYQRVGDEMRFTADDLKSEYVVSREAAEAMARRAMNGDRERMEALHERINEALRRSAGGRDYYRMPDPPWHFGKRWEHSGGDPRPRENHWGGPPRARVPEIITDPNDRRGFDARRVGPVL